MHKSSNALKMTFNDGPGEPMATAVQGAGDGKGAKAAILFGFKNGGTGRHVLTYADGKAVGVQSRDGAPTVISRGDVELATVERGATSTALRAGGGTVFTFAPAPEDSVTPDLFRMVVCGSDGTTVAYLDLVRRTGGWTVTKAIDSAINFDLWWDRAGEPMKVPFLGTRLAIMRPVSDEEKDVLLGACVDLAIGLRPYTSDMT